jgi:hypothetical protein
LKEWCSPLDFFVDYLRKQERRLEDTIPQNNVTSNMGKQISQCALCGKTIVDHQEQESSILKEVIGGISYTFDTNECVMMFKRFRSVYGDDFEKFLAPQEQFVSDPFWNRARKSRNARLESNLNHILTTKHLRQKTYCDYMLICNVNLNATFCFFYRVFMMYRWNLHLL